MSPLISAAMKGGGPVLDSRIDDDQNRSMELGPRETPEAKRSSSTTSTRSKSTFSAMKYFGLSSEPTSSDNDRAATFDVFMDADVDVRFLTYKRSTKSINPLPANDKIIASALSSALGCIADGNYRRFLQIVKNNNEILRMEVPKSSSKVKGCNGGTLLHVLVSQHPKVKKKVKGYSKKTINVQVYPSVPESVVKAVIKIFPHALEMADVNGRLPIHCACYSMAVHLIDVFRLYKSSIVNREEKRIHFKVMESNLVCLLLRYNKTCAQVADKKGNLPLHYAAAMAPDYINSRNATMHKHVKHGEPSAHRTMQSLLQAYPSGISAVNMEGMCPLHTGAFMGKKANISCLKLLIEQHAALEHPATDRNNKGDPPLYVALKNDPTPELIRCFAESTNSKSSHLFIQRDGENNNALHIALQAKYPNLVLIQTILEIAPFTAASPNSLGIMPIRDAVKLRLDTEVIRNMLARDMPIEIGTKKYTTVTPLKYKMSSSLKNRSNQSTAGRSVGRSHHHSWWYILVNCKDYYIEMVFKYLSEEATHFQIVALARQIGPDGKSILINCVSDKCRLMFHALLRFFDRYEILLSTNEMRLCYDDRIDGIQTFLALDHGPMPPISGESFPTAMLSVSNFGTAVKVECNDDTLFEIEVSMLPKDKSKVLLRTFSYDEAFYAELKVRQKYYFDAAFFEQIYNHHKNENFTQLPLSRTETLCCISFERPDHTLADVFAGLSGGTRSTKWMEKSWVVLKQIAKALEALHDQKLVHGHLDPMNICKYGNDWKVTKLGTIQKVGMPMRGTFRASVPPESVKMSKAKRRWPLSDGKKGESALNRKSGRVQFSPRVLMSGKERRSKHELVAASSSSDTQDDFFGNGCLACDSIRESGSEEALLSLIQEEGIRLDEERATATFSPGGVQASVAWDMWGFGLIMTQLLLGRCIHLTNFETPEDAVTKNLQHYDDHVLQAICNQLLSAIGREAADIVYLLLQKDPAKRPKSMKNVLSSPYFEKLLIYV